jgi:hypothetical protein
MFRQIPGRQPSAPTDFAGERLLNALGRRTAVIPQSGSKYIKKSILDMNYSTSIPISIQQNRRKSLTRPFTVNPSRQNPRGLNILAAYWY